MTAPAQTPFSDLSVLIVAWNQPELTARSLEAVRRLLPGAETVLVDNGSAPPIPQATCRSETNLGYAGGNNFGLARCTKPFLLLLNTDAILQSEQTVLTLLDFLAAHPQVAAVQATLQLADGTLDACGETFTPFGTLFHRFYREAPSEAFACPSPVLAGKGACLLLRRAALADAGGLFRDDFFCYYEDIDLCHRLWLAGHEVWFVPTEPVLHYEKSSSKRLPPRRVWRQYLSNMLSSACTLWGPYLWLRLGPGFLAALLCASLLKGVCPRISRHRLPVIRRRSDRELLRLTLAHPGLRFYVKGLMRLCTKS